MAAPRFPVVDWTASRSEKAHIIGEACRNLGFFQVINHGVEGIPQVYNDAKVFFASPLEEKKRYDLVYGEGKLLYGYVGVGKESADVANLSLTGQKKYSDLMESFQLADENLVKQDLPNCLTPSLPTLYNNYHTLGVALLDICAEALGTISPSLFTEAHSRTHTHRTVLRITRYPALSSLSISSFEGEITRISPHRDLGTLTLLHQDHQGGLEVLDPASNEWCAVPPMEGALVVNVGNVMMRWTNGRYRSSVHRVIAGPTSLTEDRVSVIMFMNPRNDTEIAPIVQEEGEEQKWAAANCGEYLDCKLEQLFNPLAREDKGACIFDD